MGELIAVFKIMPDVVDADFKSMEAEARRLIPKRVKVERVELKPIAYGLKALSITVSMEDTEAISVDGIESALAGIPGVESVQCTDVGRL